MTTTEQRADAVLAEATRAARAGGFRKAGQLARRAAGLYADARREKALI